MSKELVISSNRHETKVALIEDDLLCEVYFQRANEYSLAGSIHKGRVTRVLPGMQSAFVDLGLERDTFLYVSDFLEEHEDFDKVTGDERPVREAREPRENRERDGRDREPRDRDRDRERRPPQGPPPSAAHIASNAAPPAIESGETGAEASASPTAAPSSEARPDDRGERGGDRGRGDRGRRSRRRRTGGRGFPDSKYAPVGGEQRPSGPPSSLESAPEPEAEEPEEMAEPHAMAESAPLILPGESLKKYREAPPSVKTPAAVEPEGPGADEAEPMEEFDEPIHYPAENALPDAPVHGMLEGVVDAVSPEVLPAIPEPLAEVAPPPLPQEYVAAHAVTQQEEEDAEEAAEENEGGPAIAPGLDDEEDRDIQAMILGDIEGLDAPDQSEEGGEGGEETPVAETGGEGGATSESGSASVRERSGRYPHRASRRRRRRGGPGGPEGRVSEGRGPEGRGPAAQSPEGSRPEQSRPEQSGAESVRPEYARPQQQVVARPTQGMPSITDLLKEGQEIIVQIAKEPLGQKGARITSHIALPGRYVVYMPTLEHMGVSRKIASDEERLRLKRILQGKRPGPVGGFITRTAAEGRTEEDIAGDMLFLYNLWQDIRRGPKNVRRRCCCITIWTSCRGFCAISWRTVSRPSGSTTKSITRACCDSSNASSRRWFRK